MNSRHTVTAILFDGRRLLAAAPGGLVSTLSAHNIISVPVPDGLDVLDATAVGAWLKMELRAAQLNTAKVIWVLPRSEAIVRAVNLPKAQLSMEEEQAMVRLAISRLVSFPTEQAGIDFWRSTDDAGTASAHVAIVPAERLAWIRQVGLAAGLKLVRVGLSTGGLIAAAESASGKTAIVAVGHAGIEIAVIDGEHLAFSRVLEVPRPSKREAMAEYLDRIESEMSRAWVTHVGSGGMTPEQVLVLARGELAESVGQTLAKVMGCTGRVQVKPVDGVGKNTSDADAGAAAAVAGVLLEEASGNRSLDLGGLRKPVDKHAKTRQLVLLGVLGLIIVGGGSAVLGMLRLKSLEDEITRLQGTQGKLYEEYGRYLMVHARQKHITEWMASSPDWIEHFQAINEVFPDPVAAQMDAVNATLDSKVIFVPDSRDAKYPNGKWSAPVRATIALDGRVKARESAEDFRGKLVAGNVYQVESRGPDTPDRFSYQLLTSKLTPKPDPAPPKRVGDEKAKPAGSNPTKASSTSLPAGSQQPGGGS